MGEEIAEFRIDVPDEQLEDLQRRLHNTRWPDQETIAGSEGPWGQGIPLHFTQELARYWREDYDWRASEARFNQIPQFRTVIDGLAIHFMHIRSPHEDALPLIMSHGWPGSFVEFLKVIGPLTDPTAHGGTADQAFHLAIPSLPGFGFSDKPDHCGWGVPRIAMAWEQLMLRLGYERFAAQGGDWGSMVTTAMATGHPAHLAGIHLNMPIVAPDSDTLDSLTEAEMGALARMDYYQKEESGYSTQQSTRPQTLGYALADSPVGQMAWVVEKFHAWTDCDGDPLSILSKNELLDNVMIYWLTNSAASSARLYWESFTDVNFDTTDVPTACSIYPHEIFRTSERWASKRFTDLRHFNELDRGGHFAAFEQPELFVDELRSGFASMR